MENLRIDSGKPTVVNNVAKNAVTYRVEFPGSGWVEFVVQPGASFTVLGNNGVINMHIQDVATMGIGASND